MPTMVSNALRMTRIFVTLSFLLQITQCGVALHGVGSQASVRGAIHPHFGSVIIGVLPNVT